MQLKLHLRKDIVTIREILNIKTYEVYQTFKVYLEVVSKYKHESKLLCNVKRNDIMN